MNEYCIQLVANESYWSSVRLVSQIRTLKTHPCFSALGDHDSFAQTVFSVEERWRWAAEADWILQSSGDEDMWPSPGTAVWISLQVITQTGMVSWQGRNKALKVKTFSSATLNWSFLSLLHSESCCDKFQGTWEIQSEKVGGRINEGVQTVSLDRNKVCNGKLVFKRHHSKTPRPVGWWLINWWECRAEVCGRWKIKASILCKLAINASKCNG